MLERGGGIALKGRYQKTYKIKEKDTSKPFKVLGILVTRNTHQGTLKISQSKYIEMLLQRFNMANSNPVTTPLDKGSHLKKDEDALYENIKEYQALTRSLTYAAMSTPPDIAYITQFLSQSNKDPTQQDWKAGKRVLRYLKGTKDVGIIYRRDPEERRAGLGHMTPWGYCNANYAKDSHDQKSTSGYAFMLANGPIAWKPKKQPSVALSTTEAEYYALGITCQEGVWLKQLCQEIFMALNKSIHIFLDNTGAVALSKNPVFHSRSKHIDIRWHFIRDLIQSGSIRSSHIPGVKNGTDFLTKAVNRYEHEQCLKLLGMG